MYWISLLQQCVLFQGLTEEELKKVVSITKEERFGKGQLIFRKDEMGDSLYLVLEGAVRISLEVDDTVETLTVLDRGFHFGEMALIDDAPRSATVEALDDTKLLRIRKSSFERLLENNIDIEIKVLRNMLRSFSSRVRDIDKNLFHMRFTLRQEYMPPDQNIGTREE